MSVRVGVLVGWLGAAALLGAPEGQAQESPSAEQLEAARKLFQQGIERERDGDWVGALTQFQDVARVKQTPQVKFHIALCEENLGRWTRAIEGFDAAAAMAKNTEGAEDVAENAPIHANNLRAKVPRITISVTGTVRTSVFLLDGARIEQSRLGNEMMVDVGEHVIEVRRGDETLQRQELTMAEGATEEIELRIDDPKAAPTATAAPTTTAPPPPPRDPPSKAPAVVAGSIGIVSLIAAGVFVGLRQSAISDIKGQCSDPDNNQGCSPDVMDRQSDGETAELLAFVFGGVGVAGVATGIVLWVVLDAPDESAEEAHTGATQIGLGPSGLSIRGTF